MIEERTKVITQDPRNIPRFFQVCPWVPPGGGGKRWCGKACHNNKPSLHLIVFNGNLQAAQICLLYASSRYISVHVFVFILTVFGPRQLLRFA